MNSAVLVLNVTFEALTEISADRAVVLLAGGAAESVADVEPRFPIRSQRVELALPRTIRLLHYAYVRPRALVHHGTRATFAGILRRDNYRCGYCDASFAGTVDHILPRSRGGADSWGNLIACCARCNSVKGDRTPAEAGMRLLWEPKPPRHVEKTQRRIWKSLAAVS
jgi:5-methylcytosine-specific restriction endonuclease McrA